MKALFLDLDNTLIDRDAALQTWMEEELGSNFPPEALRALMDCDQGGYGSREAFFRMLSTFSGSSSPAIRRRFFLEFPQHVTLKPDAEALLSAFPGPKAIITNGRSSVQWRKLRAAKLEERVDQILVSEDCGVRKPDPAIFHQALGRIGCRPCQATMVGDHPAWDVAAAQAVGMQAILLRTRWFSPPDGTPSVGSLTEVAW